MLEIERARSGAPTARLDGRYLHSRHDPVREAERAMAELVRRAPPCVVFLGAGLGYHLAFLLAETDSTRVIVYEPSTDLLHAGLSATGLGSLADDPRVVVVSEPAGLSSALVQFAAGGFQEFALSTRIQSDEALFREAEAVIARFRSRLEINQNTLNRFGRVWIRNLARNIPTLIQGRPLADLHGLLDGIPGLLLAAGPTLDQIIPILPRLRERMAIVAVDTAIAPTLRAGVEPDFAVVVDPQYWNARHLDRLPRGTTLLVSDSSTHPSVFRAFPSPHFFCGSVFPLGQAIESALGEMGSLGAGGSVSTAAWDLLRLLGASEVYAAGLDLGFPGGKTHCAGSFFEALAIARADMLQPAEGVIFRYTWGAHAEYVASTGDGLVLSDRRMEVYRTWFQSQLASPGAPATSLITSGGSAIPGMEQVDPEHLLTLPKCRGRVDARTSRARGAATPPELKREYAERVRTLLAETAEDLEGLAAVAGEARDAVLKLQHDFEAGHKMDFDVLAGYDAGIMANRSRAIASFLIQRAITTISDGSGSKSIQDQIQVSQRLYSELAESAEFHAAVLKGVAGLDR